MKKIRKITDFRQLNSNSLNGGVQYKGTFDNGYGVSIVQHDFSYGNEDGLWELAVLGQDGHLTYDTPITSDVLGYLSEEDVNEAIEKVKAL